MMIRRAFTVFAQILLLLVATSNGQTTPTQSPAHPKKTLPPKTELHANWTDDLEVGFGITKQAFQDMGLGKLTPLQEASLITWIADRERQAKAAADRESQAKAAVAEHLDCGRPGTPFNNSKAEDYDNVRVYVTASGDADEIISGVRQRLRAMNGTAVVYSSDEADLTVSLVAINTEAVGGGYQLGHAISVVVSTPCTWKVGTNTAHVDTIENQFVQVGSDIPKTVDSIVSSVDTDDLEKTRSMNAAYKKELQVLNKK